MSYQQDFEGALSLPGTAVGQIALSCALKLNNCPTLASFILSVNVQYPWKTPHISPASVHTTQEAVLTQVLVFFLGLVLSLPST